MNRRDSKAPTPLKRSFGTKLSANSPLPPRSRNDANKNRAAAAANQFVDDTVNAAVGRVSTQNGRQGGQPRKLYAKSPKAATIIEARSVEKTLERGQLNSALKRAGDQQDNGDTAGATPTQTPVSKLLAFSETPSDSFQIYTATPLSNDSTAANVDSARRETAPISTLFQYSTLDATSPSFIRSKEQSNSEVADSSPQPKNLLTAYATQQLRQTTAHHDHEASHATMQSSPEIMSPDSTASVAPPTLSMLYQPVVQPQNIASPTGSIISTSTTHTTASNLFAQHHNSFISPHGIANSMGPNEYAILFPPGPLPLELEGVVQNSHGGMSMGCCVSKILNGFDIDNLQYIRGSSSNSNGADAPTIQPNDLLISLNSISILSRPYSTIISLLQQYESYPKTIVFRSLDKVWKSQFKSRTMRNVRSGKRVETAMDLESMERDLFSWVETPTRVVNNERNEAKKNETQRSGFSKKMEGIIEDVTIVDATASSSWTTPLRQKASQLFSPSNVKKVARSTPTPIKPRKESNASTVKKTNLRKKSAETPGKKKLQQIGQVLVGEDANDNQSFERILRLKKEVLKELHSIRLALIKGNNHSVNNSIAAVPLGTENGTIVKDKDGLPPVSREMLLKEAKDLRNRLGLDGPFIERFVDMQMMLQQEITKSSSLEDEVQRLSEPSKMAEELQQKLDKAYEAMKLSTDEHAAKEKEFSTLKSDLEAEKTDLIAKLRIASDRIAEKEEEFVKMKSNLEALLEEETGKSQAAEALLEETLQSKSQQEKIISSLEEEAHRKQKLLEESEATSDLQKKELYRLRTKIDDLESQNEILKRDAERTNADSAKTCKTWSEREAVLLSMIEQQRHDFDSERSNFQQREEFLNAQVRNLESLLEQEKLSSSTACLAQNDEIASLEKQIAKLTAERDDVVNRLEQTISEKDAAMDELQTESLRRINKLETERDSALNSLQEAKSSFSEKETALIIEKEERDTRINDLSEQIERHEDVVRDLQGEIRRQSVAKENQDVIIQDLNGEIQRLGKSADEQNVIKAILSENLSKHIAASEEGYVNLDELSELLQLKLKDFSDRISKSRDDCHALYESFKCNEAKLQSQLEIQERQLAEKEASLQNAALNIAQLENKLVQVAAELENCLIREQNAARHLEAERTKFHTQNEALEKALLASEQLHVKNVELTQSVKSLQTERLLSISELEAHRDDALKMLEDARISASEKEAAAMSIQTQMSQSLSQLETELDQAKLLMSQKEAAWIQEKGNFEGRIKDLTEQIEDISVSKRSDDKSVQELQEVIKGNEDIIEKQRVVKRILADNFSKYIAASEGEFVKLDALKKSVEHKLNDFCGRIARSKADCRTAVSTFHDNDVELQSRIYLQERLKIMSENSDKYESKISQIASELERSLTREQNLATDLKDARRDLSRQSDALHEMVSSKEKLEAKNSELIALVESLETERSQLIGHIQLLELEISEDSVSYKNQETKLNSMSSALEENELHLLQLKSEKQQLEIRLSTEEKKRSEMEGTLHDEISRQKSAAANHFALINELESRVKLMSWKLEDKEKSYASGREEFELKLEQKNCAIDYCKRSLSHVYDELTTAQSELSCFKYYEMEIESLHLLSTLSLRRTNAKLEKSIAVLRQRCLVSETKCSNADNKLRLTLSSLQEKEDKLSFLISEFDEMRAKATDLALEVQVVKEDRNTFKKSCTAREDQFREKLLEKENQIKVLRDDLDLKLAGAASEMEAMAFEHQGAINALTAQLAATETKASATVSHPKFFKSNIESADQLLDQGDANIQSISAECERLENQICDLTCLLERSQTDCKAYQSELSRAVAERNDLTSKLEASRSELKSNVLEIKELNERIQKLIVEQHAREKGTANERCQLEAENVEVAENIASITCDLRKTNSSGCDLRLYIDELRTDSNEERKDSTLLRNQNEILRETIEDLSIQLNQSTRDKKILEMIKNEHVNEISLLESSKEILSTKMNQLESEAQRKDASFCVEKKQLAKEVASMVQQIAALKSQNEELITTVETLKSVTRSAGTATTSLIPKRDRKQIEVDTLTHQIQQREHLSQDQSCDLHFQLEQINHLRHSLQLKEKEVSMLNDKVGKLNNQVDELKRDHVASAGSLRCQLLQFLETTELDDEDLKAHKLEPEKWLEEDTIRAKEVVSLSNGHQVDLERTINFLISFMKELTNETPRSIEAKEADVSSLTSLQDDLKMNIKHTTKELIASMIEKDRALFELLAEKKKLEETIETLRKEQRGGEKGSEISRLTAEMESVKSSSQATIAQLNAEHQSSVDARNEAEKEISTLRHDLATERSAHQDDLAEMKLLRSKLQEAASSSDSLRSEVKHTEHLLRERESEISRLTAEMESVKSSLQATIAKLNAEHQSLHLLRERESEISRLTAEMESVKSSSQATIAQLNAEHQSSVDARNEAEKEISTLRHDLATERSAHQDDLAEMEVLRSKLQEAMGWSDSFRSEVKDTEELLRERESEISRLTAEMESVKSSSQATIAQLNAEHQSSVDARNEAEKEISTLRHDLASERSAHQDDLAEMEVLRSKLQEAASSSDSLRSEVKLTEHLLRERESEISRLTTEMESVTGFMKQKHQITVPSSAS
eukprot:CCRYP_000703-RA/>CCRYP_000703-RA protein AED:0.03 eAED:0.08 QI:0/0/0/1/0/0/2/0/2622